METEHDWVWDQLWGFRYRLMKGPMTGDARRRWQESTLDWFAPRLRARIEEQIAEASRQARLDEHRILANLDEEGKKRRYLELRDE
ncbi:MAG: hypothetical protein ABI068_10685 [Ktedonobacterales bacterium]